MWTSMTYDNDRSVVFVNDFEWIELDVVLYGGVVPCAPDESLHIEHCVLGVRGELILGCIADQSLALLCECHV